MKFFEFSRITFEDAIDNNNWRWIIYEINRFVIDNSKQRDNIIILMKSDFDNLVKKAEKK